MYPHGDPIISGIENKVEDRPSSYNGPRCGYTVRTKVDVGHKVEKCNSPEVIWNVTGHGRYGSEKKTPVCEKHIQDAWRTWNVDSAEPIKK